MPVYQAIRVAGAVDEAAVELRANPKRRGASQFFRKGSKPLLLATDGLLFVGARCERVGLRLGSVTVDSLSGMLDETRQVEIESDVVTALREGAIPEAKRSLQLGGGRLFVRWVELSDPVSHVRLSINRDGSINSPKPISPSVLGKVDALLVSWDGMRHGRGSWL